MRARLLTVTLITAVAIAATLPIVACGSNGGSDFGNGSGDSGAGNEGGGVGSMGFGGEGGIGSYDASGTAGSTLSAVHIVPADATLAVLAGQQKSQTYKVMGVVNGTGPEVDVTSRFVFYVPDNYLVGGFPLNGGPTFTSRLPSGATDPPQQGGKLTVQAEALNPDGKLLQITTSLTVNLTAQLTDPSGAGLPPNPGGLFGGTMDPSRAPSLFYPNDGVMLPPNLKQLEIQWKSGSASNTLYEVSFTSAAANIVYYVRCGATADKATLAATGCALTLDQTGYGYLAQSNAGQGNVALKIRGTDDTGTAWGASSVFNIQFAQESVNGGMYYWDVSDTQIMRFDFGGTKTTPDVFLAPGDYGLPTTGTTCVGCHTLSRDGTKLVASIGGQNDGRIVYQADLTKASTPPAPDRSDPNWLTLKGDATNHIQFASFNPKGDQFVAVYADGQSAPAVNTLWFHDGDTGVRIPGAEVALSFEPDHPEWSPDGTMIAMTHVGSHGTSQREYQGGIDVATFTGTTLGAPAVVIPSLAAGKNRYNPSFVPDSSFLFYTESTCPAGSEKNENCDSDVANNLNATTWATKPVAGATPVHLDNAGKPGAAETTTPLDTFPRSTPFETKQGAGKLFWFTVASQRAPGIRTKGGTQQLLWMFAVDPAKILAGQDGSYTGFFLPFQNMATSNHIGQWTEKVVGSTPPPPPPSPPPPPPPPPASGTK